MKILGWSIKTTEKIDTIEQLSNYVDVVNLGKWDWHDIFISFQLTENFLRNHLDKIDNEFLWDDISREQELSESFIEDYADKLDWWLICETQKLSVPFLLKHFDRIKYSRLIINTKLDWKEIEKSGIDVLYKLIGKKYEDEDTYY